MNTFRLSSRLRRALAGTLAFLVAFGPISPMTAYAATAALADGPINVTIRAKPNIVYTMDDSTSMLLPFLPDYVVVDTGTNAATAYCRSATGAPTACGSVGSGTIPQYMYAEWLAGATGAVATFPYPAGYGNSSYGPPAVMTSTFNALFYNPAITYVAPPKYDTSTYNNMNATNTASFTQVPADPYLFPAKYVNLQTKVNVGVWCNTTYAGTFTGVPATDLNGIAMGGDHCRINGYTYALGGNGAPAVIGDYNYPYARNNPANPIANFFSINARTIYCDPNRMNGTDPAGVGEVAPKDPTCAACTPNCQAPAKMIEDTSTPAGCTPGCKNPAECIVCGTKCDAALTYNCTTTCTTPALDCSGVGGGKYAKLGPKTCADGANERCVTNPGACASDAAWKLDAAACNTKINGKSKNAWVPSAGTTINKTTYEQDANGSGDVCRRNNFTYTDATNGGWAMPGGAYTQAVACPGTIVASIHRHYYKAMTQWCNTQISWTAAATKDDKWRGFGSGVCQAEKNDTYKYPRFFKAGAYAEKDYATTQDNYGDNAAFELVELNFKDGKIIVRGGTPVETIDHTLENGEIVTRDSTSDTPEKSELVNYANWFAYYRTRILAGKTVTALAFSDLTDKFRVGFQALSNDPAATFLTVDDFKKVAGGHRDLWYGRIQNTKIPMSNDTPLISGLVRIGEWFKSSSGTSAELTGSTNPITLSCQKNYHIMFTDGYTNQSAASLPTFKVGNIDGTTIPAKSDDIMPVEIKGMEGGKSIDWPILMKEGATAVEDSLADYALYYWHRDLRPPTFDKSVAENNVPYSDLDPAQWQHLNFAALSLGTQGKLPSRNTAQTEKAIEAKSLAWTTPSPVHQPGVAGVDDLWHAAHAGKSRFVNARDPSELQTGLQRILKEIDFLTAARAGAAFSSVNFSASGNYVYRVTVEPGWGGTLNKVEVDPLGEAGEKAVPAVEYHKVLAKQVDPIATGKADPWFSNRNVVTWDPVAKAAKPFRFDDMPTSQTSTLGKDDNVRKQVIAYLRGDTSNEGDAPKNFRKRTQILGDIVNSSPVVVGGPSAPYSNATDADYEAFKETWKDRKKMVYVGANDGMLHAFDEATGKEVWAYVPSFVYDSTPDRGLAMLTKKEPFFRHQMFVDSTPVAADVKVGGAWKTYLFGGLGKGGKGYYAIDITNPAAIEDEDDVKDIIKWEYSGDGMGYSYGKPLIAKTYADDWVAIFPSGYNGTDKAKIHVVNIGTGGKIRTLSTTADADAGLAHVSGFVLSFKNQYLEQIYGGDLLGNVWRFDVHFPSAASWTVEKLATLKSTDGSAQSVTTAPQIEIDLANGVDRYVMVGTGRLLHEDDLVTYENQIQTMYSIRDGTVLQHGTSGLPLDPRYDAGFTVIDRDAIAGISGLTVKGWYQDMPKGERVVTPIAAELNLLGWAGALPPESECLPGLASTLYVRNFPHGGSELLDDSGNPTAWTLVEEGAVGMDFVNVYSDTPNDPTLKLAITLGTTGKTIYIDLAKSTALGDHRMSWRLLGK